MKILFNQGTPAPLRHLLGDHNVRTAYEMGWAIWTTANCSRRLKPRSTLSSPTEQNLRHQRSVHGRRFAILVLPTTSRPKIQQNATAVIAAVNELEEGDFAQLRFA